MDWDRGLKRITLVISIFSAVITADFFYKAEVKMSYNDEILPAERRIEFKENVKGQAILDRWREAEILKDQKRLCKQWTGLELGEEPKDKFPANRFIGLLPDEDIKALQKKKTGELKALKEQGWQTVKGEALFYTPEDIWYVNRKLQIKDKKFKNNIRFFTASIKGAFCGFCAVWAVYAATRYCVWPVYKYISLGFRDDGQKK